MKGLKMSTIADLVDPADREVLRKVRARLHRPRGGLEVLNLTGPTATIRVYDEIGFFGITAEDVAAQLDRITADEIEVQINSPGGDVFDGIAIYNALRAHPARVTTRVDGIAASAASVVAQAGDHRVMLTAGQMMIHEAWGVAIGPADELRAFADVLDRQNDVLAGIYASRAGRDAAEMRELMAGETWLTDEQTVEAGLADEVFDPSVDTSDSGTSANALVTFTVPAGTDIAAAFASALAAQKIPDAQAPGGTPPEKDGGREPDAEAASGTDLLLALSGALDQGDPK